MSKKGVALNQKSKERKKVIRTIIQAVIVVFLAFILIRAVFLLNKYEDTAFATSNGDGFIALSYFGVSRGESPKYVAKAELEKQLTLLAKQGYTTISQQDIIDFYEQGKPLPEKALYLSFEDGRTDSSIFAQKILEKLNYRATMYTYANKMDTKDTKFLKPNHLKLMQNSGYWELGSNGYRLTYINVFNDEGKSLGMIDENDVPDKMTIEYYNHYLMDFIRDEYMIPTETRAELEQRIAGDYGLMRDIYTETLGEVPQAYAIMHANALYNNMDRLVEKANDQHIKELYKMHFNLELDAYNEADADIYNLSRLQVSPYWPTNHLMMKIQQSSKQNVDFAIGNEKHAKQWTLANGAAEFLDNQLILTSEPSAQATLFLKQELPTTYQLEFDFYGNVVGEQSLYVKADDGSYMRIMLKDNEMVVLEKQPNQTEAEVQRYPLKEIEWSGEDYAFNKATVYSYYDTQQGSRIDEEEYPRNLKNRRHFELQVGQGELQLIVDNEPIATIAMNEAIQSTQIGFGAAYSKKDTSHEQYTDDIYDTVVEDIEITDKAGKVLFSNQYTKMAKAEHNVSTWFNGVVDFFIETF
ncbi:polysaccharide deacetylase family protein [Metasolibacillus sp.]|uniref:polysaccharide deacetylase family protein n=1 Tax=Metasolibacillus sp. TaxID=2703680 RepID=UPI0025E3E112|nr:polysaccharide deacetylase family protein [Metasolibacillus sp.]MCT6924699.1 polysaccharide deacetylase family protein [Metasolibacillus sp.]MCT6940948.1 polysaccharide deacetylase family protein [Metasolibacillus sp.]